MPTIDYQVREVASECLGVPFDDVSLTASFLDDLGADSLDLVQLVIELEEHFGVAIGDGEFLGKFSDPADMKVQFVVDLIEQKLMEKAGRR